MWLKIQLITLELEGVTSRNFTRGRNFLRTLQPQNCIFDRTWGAWQPRLPIAAKLCHIFDIWLNFIIQVQKLGVLP